MTNCQTVASCRCKLSDTWIHIQMYYFMGRDPIGCTFSGYNDEVLTFSSSWPQLKRETGWGGRTPPARRPSHCRKILDGGDWRKAAFISASTPTSGQRGCFCQQSQPLTGSSCKGTTRTNPTQHGHYWMQRYAISSNAICIHANDLSPTWTCKVGRSVLISWPKSLTCNSRFHQSLVRI